ncbi:MAG TPA: ribonuclease P protein component [Saprospiraceae bacterium]|nr:ribonuclease P protein component [Saprospiraceae bacterium]
MKFTLGKHERLKSRTLIKKLYEEGQTLKVFPLRMMYLQTNHTSKFPTQVGVSVPKRNFKHAVDRNRIKRLMRESYRKNKYLVYNEVDEPYVYMIYYLAKAEWKYIAIEKKMILLLTNFIKEIKKKEYEKTV